MKERGVTPMDLAIAQLLRSLAVPCEQCGAGAGHLCSREQKHQRTGRK